MVKNSDSEVTDIILQPGSDTTHPNLPHLLHHFCDKKLRPTKDECLRYKKHIYVLFESTVVGITEKRNIKIKTSFYFFIYKVLSKPKICLLVVENSACLRRHKTNKGKAKQNGIEIIRYLGGGWY